MLESILIALSMVAQTVAAQDIQALERRGEALLGAKCARCHAVLRTGESPHSAAPAFRTLSRRYPIEGLAESLAEGLSVGHSDMPEFVFERDEIAAILAYLNSIQGALTRVGSGATALASVIVKVPRAKALGRSTKQFRRPHDLRCSGNFRSPGHTSNG